MTIPNLFFTFIFIAQAASSFAADIDYTYCRQALASLGLPASVANPSMATFPPSPIELSVDGRISPSQNVTGFDIEANLYSYPLIQNKIDTGFYSSITATVNKDDKGVLKSIVFQNPSEYFTNYSGQVGKISTKRIIEFKIQNGKCIPSVGKVEITEKNGSDTKTTTSTDFNLKLCHELGNYYQANPEAASCFKQKLNDEVSKIIENHITVPNVLSEYGIMRGSFYVEDIAAQGLSPGQNVYVQIAELKAKATGTPSSLVVDPEMVKWQRMAYGASPVIAGHSIMQGCVERGLAPVLADDSVWKAEALPNAGPGTRQE